MKDNLPIDIIFTFRYMLDTPTDIVDLKQDIRDLEVFPERLEGSYLSEWSKYIKRKAHKDNININNQEAKRFIAEMSKEQLDEYLTLIAIIERAKQISSSRNIKVIKTPLKTYIESLIKI